MVDSGYEDDSGDDPMKKYYNDEVYTTTQAAQISGFSVKKIQEWVDSGMLKGYRIPGTRKRNIPNKFLVDFLYESEIPFEATNLEAR